MFADKTMNNRTGRSSTLKNVKYYADGRSGQTGNFECPSIYFGCILNCSLNLPDHKNSKDPDKKSTFLAPIQTYKIRTNNEVIKLWRLGFSRAAKVKKGVAVSTLSFQP